MTLLWVITCSSTLKLYRLCSQLNQYLQARTLVQSAKAWWVPPKMKGTKHLRLPILESARMPLDLRWRRWGKAAAVRTLQDYIRAFCSTIKQTIITKTTRTLIKSAIIKVRIIFHPANKISIRIPLQFRIAIKLTATCLAIMVTSLASPTLLKSKIISATRAAMFIKTRLIRMRARLKTISSLWLPTIITTIKIIFQAIFHKWVVLATVSHLLVLRDLSLG